MQPNQPFLADVQEIRRRARQHMEKGAVTEGYKADLQTVLRLLNEALATEIVCVLRYKRHQFMAHGLEAQSVAAEFAEHAAEEQGHADRLAERITQLGGEPNFSPEGLLSRSHSEYVEGNTLVDMIKEDLVAERIAIESYSEIIRYLGNNDSTSRRLMEEILAKEEEHAEDMHTLIERVSESGTLNNKGQAFQPAPDSTTSSSGQAAGAPPDAPSDRTSGSAPGCPAAGLPTRSAHSRSWKRSAIAPRPSTFGSPFDWSCARLASSFTVSPICVASVAFAACACPVTVTFAPNFTPPASC